MIRLFALLSLAYAVSACTTTGGRAPGLAACQPWKAIRYSRRDTPPTIDQVKGNNARRDAFCA